MKHEFITADVLLHKTMVHDALLYIDLPICAVVNILLRTYGVWMDEYTVALNGSVVDKYATLENCGIREGDLLTIKEISYAQ